MGLGRTPSAKLLTLSYGSSVRLRADIQTGENRNSADCLFMGDMSGQHFTEISRYITCCDAYVRRYLWMRCYTNKHPLVKLYEDYTRMHSSRMRTGPSLTACRGVHASQGGGYMHASRGGGIPACTEADPPVDRITDTSKNITLATTSLRPVIRTNSLCGMAFTFGLFLSVNNHDLVTYGPHASYSQVGFNSRYWLHCHSNVRVSRTKIENLRWEDIKFITFRKKCVHKNCESRYWLPISLFTFFLKFRDQWCYRLAEGYWNNISTDLSS